MPAFGRDGILKPDEISAVADYRPLAVGSADRAGRRSGARARRCSPTIAPPAMAPDGKGNHEIGAPNLTDKIWLYGSDKATIMEGVHQRPRRRDAGLGRPPRARRPSRR